MKNNFDQIIKNIKAIEKQLKIVKKYVKLYNIKNRKEINVNQNIKNNNEKVNVFDVVNFLLKHFDTDKYKITNMKINKLLYYIQGNYIAKYNEPLFLEPIEAWMFGPVIAHIYGEFFHFVNNPIPNNYICEGKTGNEINQEIQEFIKKTLNNYINLSSYDLSVKTHNEKPWKNAYNPRKKWKNNIITPQSLKDFFAKEQKEENKH
ncbi:MAG: phage-associated protein [Candidatus Phytoplasma pruni]|nr:MAG: phage-associated protein [Candidatus Phytoplasma pruni]